MSEIDAPMSATAILAAIKAHHAGPGLRKLVVPEWGGCTLYYKPATITERHAVGKHATDMGSASATVQGIILKALSADGTKLFTDMNEMLFLNEADGAVLQRVSDTLMGFRPVNPEPALKTGETREERAEGK